MAGISVNKLHNCNVYVDGSSYLGRAEEVTLPTVTAKLADHKGLGMVGLIETPTGIEKMECKIKWTSVYPEVLSKSANPFKTVDIQVRASLESYDASGLSSEVPVVAYMSGRFKTFPGIGFKHQDNAEVETTMSVSYFKVQIDGKDKIEVDAFANIWKVDGTDIIQKYKQNIGQ